MSAVVALLILECSKTLVVYPTAPPAAQPRTPTPPPAAYAVTLNGLTAPTYISVAPVDGPIRQRGKTASWVSWDADAVVEVRITPLTEWKRCVVRPISLGVKCARVNASSAALLLSPGAQVSIEFDDVWETHALLLFANYPEEPFRSGAVIEFGAGLHDIGVGYEIPANVTVHLAAGAWVRGTFASKGGAASGVEIHGRGVLDGGLIAHPPTCDDSLALINLCGDDISISGITLVNAPTYLLEVNAFWQGGACATSSRTTVSNVKLLAWHYTSDGIMVGRDSVVSSNFVKCNDDALKLFMGRTSWTRNTIWQEDNGQSFMLSWVTPTNETNISVSDSTVIHVEHDHDYGDQARPAVFGSVHGGAGELFTVTFHANHAHNLTRSP